MIFIVIRPTVCSNIYTSVPLSSAATVQNSATSLAHTRAGLSILQPDGWIEQQRCRFTTFSLAYRYCSLHVGVVSLSPDVTCSGTLSHHYSRKLMQILTLTATFKDSFV